MGEKKKKKKMTGKFDRETATAVIYTEKRQKNLAPVPDY